MSDKLAQTLMLDFADVTGITGKTKPRRYVWTDAFAACNFLGLYRETGNSRYLDLAVTLVDQVHHTLGRHREDDPRRGWISGLPEEEGERHPTRGGLRIGKKLNERGPHQPPDSRLEWDQDGQYFHYLTKWMHALYCMSRETGDQRYLDWAAELAQAAHQAFTYETFPSGPKRMAWKLSIDLRRPLVSSMGLHDPLDGLVACLELRTAEGFDKGDGGDLSLAITDMTAMCARAHWATDDLLGIGGLLDDATRLAQMHFQRGVNCHELLAQVLIEAELSLRTYDSSSQLRRIAEHRLAFRELGLSIGLQGLERIRGVVAQDRKLATIVELLRSYRPLAHQIQTFWSDPDHRLSNTWTDHRDINTVMLATSLSPEGYFNADTQDSPAVR